MKKKYIWIALVIVLLTSVVLYFTLRKCTNTNAETAWLSRGIGFICRNCEGNRQKDFYTNTIYKIERITGITFFPNLANDIAEVVKKSANLDEWK